VLEIIKWMEAHSLFWATAGHIPPNQAVTESAEYKAMQPQATYAVLTRMACLIRNRSSPASLRRSLTRPAMPSPPR